MSSHPTTLAAADDRGPRDVPGPVENDGTTLRAGRVPGLVAYDLAAGGRSADADGGATVVEAKPDAVTAGLAALTRSLPSIGVGPALPSDGPRLGRYPVTSRLGAGGMGEVYAVFDGDLKREVAAKVVRGEVDARHVRKFVLEAQITGQLQHPAIVPVYELGRTAEGQLYFTMKKIEGRTLAAMLEEDLADDPLPGRPSTRPSGSPARSAEPGPARLPATPGEGPEAPARDRRLFERMGVMLKVCDAVAFAHSKGVIHRDLKPDNVMIGAFGEVLVCDWGLAKVLAWEASEDHAGSALTPTATADGGVATIDGDVMGTPAYMPPEQAQGQIALIDERADIYALGAMLYQVLSGQPPYVGSTSRAVLEQVVAAPPVPLVTRAPDRAIPWELEAVVRRAMERAPAARYPSVEALKADIEAFLGGRLVAAAHYTPLQRAMKLVRRHARAVAAVSVAVVSIVGASIYVAVSAHTQLGAVTAAKLEAVASEKRAVSSEEKAQEEARAAQHNLADAKRMGVVQQLKGVVGKAEALWWTPSDERTGTLRHPPTVDRLTAVQGEIASWLAEADALLAQRPTLEAAAVDAAATAANRDVSRLPDEDSWLTFRAAVMADLVAGIRELARQREKLFERRKVYARWAIEHARRAEEWRRARIDIAASARYGGLRLEPQVGIVPLGPDPRTGLWLFAVAGTGRFPRSAAEIADDTAMVMVLLPGGRCRVGARNGPAGDYVDPHAFSHEGPDNEVVLEPYFIARTEMTNHQWLTLAATRPSQYGVGTKVGTSRVSGRHPVESINWDDCTRELSRVGLVVPSEAQWEVAARGGRGTVYWMGNDPAGLARTDNLADALLKRNDPGVQTFEAWDDGHFIYAPVAFFADGANPFGLYDVLGNVREWCRDTYDERAYDKPANSHGDRPGPENPTVRLRVYRGGSWCVSALHARASYRFGYTPALRDPSLGVRPVRFVTGIDSP